MPDENDEIIMDESAAAEEAIGNKLKKLREELKLCQKEKADYLAGWQRAKADFINAKRDEERTRAEFAKFATERVVREMLTVADSLELSGGDDSKPVYNQLIDILKKEGVEKIKAMGEQFDPLYLEALEQVEVSDEEKDGMVLEELQKGYVIYNRVLRPSKVKVGIYKQK